MRVGVITCTTTNGLTTGLMRLQLVFVAAGM